MFMTILAYVLALPVILLVSTIAYMLLMPFAVLTQPLTRSRPFHIARSFGFAFLSAGVAVLAFIGLCKCVGVAPSLCMVLIPLIAFGRNDLSRINQAEAGTSRVAQMMELEGKEYDTRYGSQLATAAMIGHGIAFFGVPFVLGIPFW